MNELLKEQLSQLAGKSWTVIVSPVARPLPSHICSRYQWVPESTREFIGQIQEASSPSRKAWLLGSADYDDENAAFAWNEWERLSLEATDDDADWQDQIRSFWDNHLPICLSISDGYAYYALTRTGEVVFGREPEFEEPSVIAPSLVSFLQYVGDHEA